MNIIEIIRKGLFGPLTETFYRDRKTGEVYKFERPADIRYQGEASYYRNVKTGKIKLLYGGDLEMFEVEKK